MYVSFSRYSGPYELDDNLPTKISTALAVGDALRENTGLDTLTSNSYAIALALQAKAVGDTTQDGILTMIITAGRTKFYGEAEVGTFVRADDAGKNCDINSANGLDADTFTNGDWLIRDVLSTTQAIGQFSIRADSRSV